MKRDEVYPEEVSRDDVNDALQAELSRWPEAERDKKSEEAIDIAMDLLRRAAGGVLMVVAPRSDLFAIEHETTDSGYMTNLLHGKHIGLGEVQQKMLDFTAHTQNDCWPLDHPDRNARGKAKDGAFLVHPNGIIAKCSVIVNCQWSTKKWADSGGRRKAAFALSQSMECGVILVGSSASEKYVLLAGEQDRIRKLTWLGEQRTAEILVPPGAVESAVPAANGVETSQEVQVSLEEQSVWDIASQEPQCKRQRSGSSSSWGRSCSTSLSESSNNRQSQVQSQGLWELKEAEGTIGLDDEWQ
jgi:hypothetical protein